MKDAATLRIPTYYSARMANPPLTLSAGLLDAVRRRIEKAIVPAMGSRSLPTPTGPA